MTKPKYNPKVIARLHNLSVAKFGSSYARLPKTSQYDIVKELRGIKIEKQLPIIKSKEEKEDGLTG